MSNSLTFNTLSAFTDVLNIKNTQSEAFNSKNIRRYLDFSNFDNFVTFGSAELEVDNALLAIQDLYPSFDKWDLSVSNLTLTADQTFISLYTGWIENLDPYANYLIDNSLSLPTFTVTVTGGSTERTYQGVFVDIDSNGNLSNTVVQNEFETIAVSAESFDKYNFNSLYKMIPEIITERDEDLTTLLKICGHFFDDIYLASTQSVDVYNMSYNFDEMPNDKLLSMFIQSLGMGEYYQMTEKDLLDYYSKSSDLNYTKQEFSRLMKIIFINNIMYIIKSKGTREAIEASTRVFGWPKGLIDVEEYITGNENLPASGLTFDLSEIYYRTLSIQTENSPTYFDVYNPAGAGKINLVEAPFHFVYNFSLSGARDLRDGIGQDAALIWLPINNTSMITETMVDFAIDTSISGFKVRQREFPSTGVINNTLDFPLTASKYDGINDSTIFTFGVGIDNPQLMSFTPDMFLGYYNDTSSFGKALIDPTSVSSNVIGNLQYDIRNFPALGTNPVSGLSRIIMHPMTGGNFVSHGLKFYEGPATGVNHASIFNSISGHVLMPELIKSKETVSPSKWYKFNNLNTSLSSIPDSAPTNRMSMTAAVTGTTTLVKKPYTATKQYQFKTGDNVDSIGIWPDIAELDWLNSSNKLKVIISPAKVINNFIDHLLGHTDIDNFGSIPSDLYKNEYSYLRTLRSSMFEFLDDYSPIEFTDFFESLYVGYHENIFNFITKNLIPAKSDADSGVVIENDKLDYKKYKWTAPAATEEAHNDDISLGVALETTEVVKNVATTNSLSYASDELIQNANSIDHTLTYESELISLSVDHNLNETTEAEDENFGSAEEKHPLVESITASYEDAYWYKLGLWGINKDYQGHETSVCSLTGSSLYGMSKWKAPSGATRSADAFKQNLAHTEQSKLVVSNDSKEIVGSEHNSFHVNLLRYGSGSPGAHVKINIPTISLTNQNPIIGLSGLASGDHYNTPISGNLEYDIILSANGRQLDYYLNIDTATSAQSLASTFVNFGKLGPAASASDVTMPIYAGLENQGSAGNGLKFVIQLDEDLQSDYAKVDVINDRSVILYVAETPYIIYGILSALTGNIKAMELLTFDISNITAAEAVSGDSDYKSYAFGEFYLQNGADTLGSIKNKTYKINLTNIYNNEDSANFDIIPRVKTTMVDSNKNLENQSNSW
jgi:hypothetical protein